MTEVIFVKNQQNWQKREHQRIRYEFWFFHEDCVVWVPAVQAFQTPKQVVEKLRALGVNDVSVNELLSYRAGTGIQ